jgi:hypothetical protein
MDQGQLHNYGIKYQSVWLVVCFVVVADSNLVEVAVDSNPVVEVAVDSNPVVEIAVVAVDSTLVEVVGLVVGLVVELVRE